MLGLISSPGPIWLSVARSISAEALMVFGTGSAHFRAATLCWIAFVFRNASVIVSKFCCGMATACGCVSAACIRAFHLAEVRGTRFIHHASAVGVVDCRGGLATFIGAAACSFTGLIKDIFEG